MEFENIGAASGQQLMAALIGANWHVTFPYSSDISSVSSEVLLRTNWPKYLLKLHKGTRRKTQIY